MKLRKKKIILLLSLFCISIFFISIVSAKYIHKTENTGTITAKEFYFKSDLLDGGTHTVTASGDTASVTVRLMNHEDALRCSETDISYTISIKNNDGTEVTAEGSDLTGIITGGVCNDKDVTINGLQPGKTYTITASTENYYSKTLTGTIKVNSTDRDIHTAISDKEAYIEVTVWSREYAGTVKLDYCQGLIPDNTDSLLKDAKNATASTPAEVTLADWKADTSHVFRFFKNDENKKYKVETTADASDNEKKVTVSEQ